MVRGSFGAKPDSRYAQGTWDVDLKTSKSLNEAGLPITPCKTYLLGPGAVKE